MSRAGYPVRVVGKTKRRGLTLNQAAAMLGDQTEWYWCVDAGMIGTCGHKHRTEEAAKKCLEPMTLKYRETRWPGSTKKG